MATHYFDSRAAIFLRDIKLCLMGKIEKQPKKIRFYTILIKLNKLGGGPPVKNVKLFKGGTSVKSELTKQQHTQMKKEMQNVNNVIKEDIESLIYNL